MAVTRLYQTAADAAEATIELRQAGFSQYAVETIDNSAGPVSSAALVKKGVARSRAGELFEPINHGAALVIVDAPLGTARRANAILDKPRGGDTGPVTSQYEAVIWDFATPLSALLGAPVLIDDPTPLSSWLKWPVLTKTAAFLSTRVGMPLTSPNPAPLSTALKMPLLSDKPAPLSTSGGLNILTGEPAPLSKRVNMRVLLDEPAPLSKRLGMQLISHNPAPLSSLFGLPVLWR